MEETSSDSSSEDLVSQSEREESVKSPQDHQDYFEDEGSDEEEMWSEISRPVSLVFRSLSLRVDVRKWFVKVDEKQILSDISGYAQSGQLLAILGSSGTLPGTCDTEQGLENRAC